VWHACVNLFTVARRIATISYYALDSIAMRCDASTEFSSCLITGYQAMRNHLWACATPVNSHAPPLAHYVTGPYDLQAMTSTGCSDTAINVLADIVMRTGQA
jgi:hypothetical protein